MNTVLLDVLAERRPFQWHMSGDWYRYDDEGLWRSTAFLPAYLAELREAEMERTEA